MSYQRKDGRKWPPILLLVWHRLCRLIFFKKVNIFLSFLSSFFWYDSGHKGPFCMKPPIWEFFLWVQPLQVPSATRSAVIGICREFYSDVLPTATRGIHHCRSYSSRSHLQQLHPQKELTEGGQISMTKVCFVLFPEQHSLQKEAITWRSQYMKLCLQVS